MTGSVGGVLSGVNPFDYNPSSPITLFLFQTCLILATCNLVHIVFAKMRQPKVISEVIAGVILGPTVLGQIPNYTNTVFPEDSVVGLNLTSNLGIILFMFFLGLEVDTEFIKKHIKTALSIGLVSLAVPFGCGCLFAIPLFNVYANKDADARVVKFTVFMVFIAVSISVTAFPVLCRILNELRLIKDRAGIVVLAAGIINDILGWILLALSVILSNSESSPVNTVYILLCALGWFLLYSYPVKYALKWTLLRTHELEKSKPSPMATMIILFLMFISAYFTDIIGVHPIFGAFIAGLIVPREQNYVVKLAERMEDIPNIVLIPIYFAVAGLNVDLTLLNEGRDWGYVFASIGIAIGAKVIAGTVVAKIHGLFFKEAAAVGILMSCKGIVEIVVLTVGLNAEIISKKIFGMFILMALVSTFVTTPLTQLVYTDQYRKELKMFLEADSHEKDHETSSSDTPIMVPESSLFPILRDFDSIKNYYPSKIINVINSAESMSANLELLNLLTPRQNGDRYSQSSGSLITFPSRKTSVSKKPKSKLRRLLSAKEDHDATTFTIAESTNNFEISVPVKAVHLKMLTERTTDLLQSSAFYKDDPNFISNSDSVLQIFDIFTRLSKIEFSSEVIFTTVREKASNLTTMECIESDIVLLPLRGKFYDPKLLMDLQENFSNFEHFYSHLLGVNELSSNFFPTLATSLKAHFILEITNTSKVISRERYEAKVFNLLLNNPYLSSSDYLAIFVFLLISHNEIKEGNSVRATILVNDKNAQFADGFYQLLSAFSLDENVVNVTYVNTESKINAQLHSFMDMILESGLVGVYDLEGSVFIIPEAAFSKHDPFSVDVKSTILHGANKKFTILVIHYYFQNPLFKKSESIT